MPRALSSQGGQDGVRAALPEGHAHMDEKQCIMRLVQMCVAFWWRYIRRRRRGVLGRVSSRNVASEMVSEELR